MRKKIAIIGASTGQLPLCLKAREMDLETFCFAWDEGAVCKNYVDHFISISIFEMDTIVYLCLQYKIDGVVSNASESTALVASYVADKLGKNGTPYDSFVRIQDKVYVREKTNSISNLQAVNFTVGLYTDILNSIDVPFVLKPIKGAAKKGVNFVNNLKDDLHISDELKDAIFMVEEYIEGKEYSVESLSYHNKHEVIQITEKIGSGAPHFVELEHHQPANLSKFQVDKIHKIIPLILEAVGFTNGASHTEIKIDNNDNIFLVEVNPRGGGDFISNDLIGLSTDYDYLKQLILISLDMFTSIPVNNKSYSGVYFLSAYSARLLPYFKNSIQDWMVKRERMNDELTFSSSNYDRNGYIIYSSNKKIIL